MRKVLGNSDLLAGLGAVGLLLLCAFPLQLALPLSIALAIAAYVGLRLALPRRQPRDAEEALASTLARCEEQVTAIGQFAGWAGFAGKPEVRQRLLTIARSARRILTAITQDPNKHATADRFLSEYLDPITTLLGNYIRLAGRDLDLARDELAALETRTLPLIERRLNALYEQMHSADVAAFEIESKMLEYTLQPLSSETSETYLPDEELPTGPEGGVRQGRHARLADAAAETAKEQAG